MMSLNIQIKASIIVVFLSFFLACEFLTNNQSMYHAFRTLNIRLLARNPVVVPNFNLLTRHILKFSLTSNLLTRHTRNIKQPLKRFIICHGLKSVYAKCVDSNSRLVIYESDEAFTRSYTTSGAFTKTLFALLLSFYLCFTSNER